MLHNTVISYQLSVINEQLSVIPLLIKFDVTATNCTNDTNCIN